MEKTNKRFDGVKFTDSYKDEKDNSRSAYFSINVEGDEFDYLQTMKSLIYYIGSMPKDFENSEHRYYISNLLDCMLLSEKQICNEKTVLDVWQSASYERTIAQQQKTIEATSDLVEGLKLENKTIKERLEEFNKMRT